MAFRYLYGDAKPVKLSATVAEPIAVGDACVLVSNKASPASTLADSGTTAQNQEAAHDIFLGLALDQKLDDDTQDIMIATEGTWECDCDALSQDYDIGSYFGLEGTGASDAVGVANQRVAAVATANLAIGILAEFAASGATKVKIRLAGVLTTPYQGCQAFA